MITNKKTARMGPERGTNIATPIVPLASGQINNADSPNELLTYQEVAQVLRITPRTVRNIIVAGELHVVAVGGSRRILRTDLEDYITRNRRRA